MRCREVHTLFFVLAFVGVVLGGRDEWDGEISIFSGSHGVLQTPNFPYKFETPFTKRWLINATAHPVNSTIKVYFTQMFIANGTIQITEYSSYEEDKIMTDIVKNSRRGGKRQVESRIGFWKTNIVASQKLDTFKTKVVSTKKYPFLAIDLHLRSPYLDHIRLPEFLDTFGFNITFEIVKESKPLLPSCSLASCSYAGNCFVSRDFTNFFCDCLPGYYGTKCEYGPKCDPKRNINFCLNGGECKHFGLHRGACKCKEGYSGSYCQKEITSPVKECQKAEIECEGEGHCAQNVKTAFQSRRPCSSCNGKANTTGWEKFEGRISLQMTGLVKKLSIWDLLYNETKDSYETELLGELKVALASTLTNFCLNKEATLGITNISVVAIRPGPEVVFRFKADRLMYNNASCLDALKSLESKGDLVGGVKFGPAAIAVLPPLNLKELTLNKILPVRVESGFSLTCLAVGSTRMSFKWFKDGVPINESLATRYLYFDRLPRTKDDEEGSILMIDTADLVDQGTFTCEVSDMEEENCKDERVEVLPSPIIEVHPMSLTLIKNQTANIICSAVQDHHLNKYPFGYTWTKNGQLLQQSRSHNEVVEDLYPFGSLLRVLGAEESAVYNCTVTNNAGVNSRAVHVMALDSYNSPSCRAELDSRHQVWNWTAAQSTAMERCPPGFKGFAQRPCHLINVETKSDNSPLLERTTIEKWGETDFSRCVSDKLASIEYELQSVKMGFEMSSGAEAFLGKLQNWLQGRTSLYRGEGERVVNVLAKAAKYVESKERVIESFGAFFEGLSLFLSFNESLINDHSLVSLRNIALSMASVWAKATNFSSPLLFESTKFVVEGARVEWVGESNEASNSSNNSILPTYTFPRKGAEFISGAWVNQVGFNIPIVLKKNESAGNIVVVIFRDIASILSKPNPRNFLIEGNHYELVSPLVYFNFPNGYTFKENSHIKILFTIPETFSSSTDLRGRFSCVALEYPHQARISWKLRACGLKTIANNVAHCECDRFGQFALLWRRQLDEEVDEEAKSLHWSVVSGSMICIVCAAVAFFTNAFHAGCHIGPDRLSLIKMLFCLSLISTIFLFLVVQTDSASVALSTTFTSLVIVSLCCQLAKVFNVLITTQLDLFPFLRSVSLLTLFLAISFASLLPLWTAAAISSSTHEASYNVVKGKRKSSVLEQGSILFCTFLTISGAIGVLFLFVYYKAGIGLKKIGIKSDSNGTLFIEYRKKTLRRSLCITASSLLTILTMILHGVRAGPFRIYEYAYGTCALALGIIVLVSYTILGETPIPHSLTKFFYSKHVEEFDPEKNAFESLQGPAANRTPLKLLNGPVSSNLLGREDIRDPSYELYNSRSGGGSREITADTLTDNENSVGLINSRHSSVNKNECQYRNSKRSSVTSYNAPTDLSIKNEYNEMKTQNGGISKHPTCESCCKKNKSFKMWKNNNNTGMNNPNVGIGAPKTINGISSFAPNFNNFGANVMDIGNQMRPERGKCLLREIAMNSDYVLPSSSKLSFSASDGSSCSFGSYGNGAGIPPGSVMPKELFAGAYVDHDPKYRGREVPQFVTFHEVECHTVVNETYCQFEPVEYREERAVEGGALDLTRIPPNEPPLELDLVRDRETVEGQGTKRVQSRSKTDESEMEGIELKVCPPPPSSLIFTGVLDEEGQRDKGDLLVKKISEDLDILLDRNSLERPKISPL